MNRSWTQTGGSLLWAGMFDLFHRFVTFNMIELRRMVRGRVRGLGLRAGARVLDFGCGTGLYAGLLIEEGLQYEGFDIDQRFVTFGEVFYPKGRFHSRWADVAAAGPFDLIIANCCFHHISDDEAAEALAGIRALLAPDGVFLFIDHLPPSQARVTRARQAYRLLERGSHIRVTDEYVSLIQPVMAIESRAVERSYVMSFASRMNPLFNELVVLVCRPR